MTWDAVDGATYEVSIWWGDADAGSEDAVAVATSGVLTETRWRLPSNLENGVTYFWRVTTTDVDGKVSESPVWSFDLGGRVTLQLAPGWNLLSVPFDLESYTGRQLLQKGLFRLDGGNYVQATSVDSGNGYWLFHQSERGEPLDLLPANIVRGAHSLVIYDGWNLLGPTESDHVLNGPLTVWQFADGVWSLVDADANGAYHLNAGQGYMVFQAPAASE